MPSGTSRYYALEGQVHTTRSTRGFDYEAFCDCFDGLSFEQLKMALQNVSEEFPQYIITGNIEYSIPKVYEYLNGM